MKAVDGLSLKIGAGETVALVGELGCGKSLSALSIMRLLPDPPARIVGGAVQLNGRDIVPVERGDHARHPGQGDRHDLPGPDELAEPGGHASRSRSPRC